MQLCRAFFTASALIFGAGTIFGQTSLERDLAGNAYRPHDPVVEELKIVGSRSMSTVLDQWGEGLKKHHPKLKIDLDCEGSETVFGEIALGQNVVAALSRPLTGEESKKLSEKIGQELLTIPVCHYEIVLVSHPDNPLDSIKISDARNLFLAKISEPNREKVRSPQWGDLGATGEWAGKPIALYGRDKTSGTRAALRLMLGNPMDQIESQAREFASFRELVQAVAKNPSALGYSSRRIATQEVKILPLIGEDGKPVPQLLQTMYLVAPRQKDKTLHPAALELIAYALSQSGQTVVTQDNFRPLDLAEVHAGLDKAGFSPIK
jgi:phosphate transport system substrate-binding protein